MRKLVVLGSTGSIGTQTLSVVRHLQNEFQVVGLSSYGSNKELFIEQIAYWKPQMAAVGNADLFDLLSVKFPDTRFVFGEEGLIELASLEGVDLVVLAITGLAALTPCLSAIRAGKTIALASKEVLVAAGEFIMKEMVCYRANIIPIDSEHSGIFQCLEGKNLNEVERIVLTASGGPLACMSSDELAHVTVEKVLNHPTWNMGPKVTVDCSTLVNKGLEIIEAYWLFGLELSQIEAVIHPQSVIHGLVEFKDGSIIAQMTEPKMTYPIQYALTWPKRGPRMHPPFDFLLKRNLEFYPPDDGRFPSLSLAKEVLKLKKSYACCYNAANEILVGRFLNQEISWTDISCKLCRIVEDHKPQEILSIDDVIELDHLVRQQALTK